MFPTFYRPGSSRRYCGGFTFLKESSTAATIGSGYIVDPEFSIALDAGTSYRVITRIVCRHTTWSGSPVTSTMRLDYDGTVVAGAGNLHKHTTATTTIPLPYYTTAQMATPYANADNQSLNFGFAILNLGTTNVLVGYLEVWFKTATAGTLGMSYATVNGNAGTTITVYPGTRWDVLEI